ncbi:TNFAIP3-interacting protein 1 isoform X10 [Ictalurus punctatus]|uniref:TNFAIP3-interacting protein 1 n=1 Tax=Ictalurus punctatus TaxID=7998 RepID=A0A9F7TNM9_ICTPU|nr:TNFAIP3-interacting protein 1 isoform X10 [Ictalurus punctatus]
MDGKGPYRIYDPGGSEAQSKEEASSYRQLLEENTVLRERMKGLKSLGHGKLLSHQASVRSDPRECLPVKTVQTEASETSSHFELVNTEDKTMAETQTENTELASQLQRLESSFSVFAQESNPNQLLAHLGRMAVEFHTLSSKVQKNEQRTSLLQTLCEQLRQENSELRKKMEEDLQYRNRDLEQLRQENLKLREQVSGRTEAAQNESAEAKDEATKEEAVKVKLEAAMTQQVHSAQSSKAAEKTPSKTLDPEMYEKKIRLLEKQRRDVLEVNKQWDIQWNSMKTQYEQKITDLRQRLADSQKAVQELEAEREQRQRDYDKKLLLAKSKIDNVQGEKECLTTETCELKQKVRYLQDQLVPLTKQREYQEKEIQRLNRALEEALNLHSPTSQAGMNLGEGVLNLRQQELHTQIAVLKEQVKIFEEDFQKERRDRERMNEEKEDLRRQVERLQGQMTNLTNQLHQAQNECQRERTERCKLERLQMQHNKQVLEGQPERRTSDPTSGSANGPLSPPYCGPFVQVGHQLEGWPVHFPPRMPTLSAAPGRDFQPVNPGFHWQTSFPQLRGSRVQTDAARAPPESAGPRVWRTSGQEQNPSCLKSRVKFPQSVMIWVARSSAGVGPVCFLESRVDAASTRRF